MSTSTTTQVLGPTIHEVLQAYNTHHTGHEEPFPPPQLHHPQVEASEDSSSQGPQHDVDREQSQALATRRRVPPYRRTGREHAYSSRPGGLNWVEEVLVVTLFLGVYVTGVSPSYLNILMSFFLTRGIFSLQTDSGVTLVAESTISCFIMTLEESGSMAMY